MKTHQQNKKCTISTILIQQCPYETLGCIFLHVLSKECSNVHIEYANSTYLDNEKMCTQYLLKGSSRDPGYKEWL